MKIEYGQGADDKYHVILVDDRARGSGIRTIAGKIDTIEEARAYAQVSSDAIAAYCAFISVGKLLIEEE